MQKLQSRLTDLGEEAGEEDIETRILKSWMQGREAMKKKDPDGQEEKLTSSLAPNQSGQRNLCSQWVFLEVPRNPSLLKENLRRLGACCYSILSEVMEKSQWTDLESRNAARVTVSLQ